jgi:hypothetical protein
VKAGLGSCAGAIKETPTTDAEEQEEEEEEEEHPQPKGGHQRSYSNSSLASSCSQVERTFSGDSAMTNQMLGNYNSWSRTASGSSTGHLDRQGSDLAPHNGGTDPQQGESGGQRTSSDSGITDWRSVSSFDEGSSGVPSLSFGDGRGPGSGRARHLTTVYSGKAAEKGSDDDCESPKSTLPSLGSGGSVVSSDGAWGPVPKRPGPQGGPRKPAKRGLSAFFCIRGSPVAAA